MNDEVVFCAGEQVSVSKEVADFLSRDRKQMQAQEKQDQRHLSKRNFETVLSRRVPVLREVEDTALRNLQLENLRKAVKRLNADEQQLIFLYFECELTMEEIGGRLGVSKMTISKRLKKLYAKLRDSVE